MYGLVHLRIQRRRKLSRTPLDLAPLTHHCQSHTDIFQRRVGIERWGRCEVESRECVVEDVCRVCSSRLRICGGRRETDDAFYWIVSSIPRRMCPSSSPSRLGTVVVSSIPRRASRSLLVPISESWHKPDRSPPATSPSLGYFVPAP